MARRFPFIFATLAIPGLAAASLVASQQLSGPRPGRAAGPAPASLTARTVRCDFPHGVYHTAIATVKACGDTVSPLLSTAKLPGGGREYVYEVNGNKAIFDVPPSGFLPFKATARQLREYNIPARPKAGLRYWLKEIGHAHVVPPPRYLVTLHSLNFGSRQLGNWAGNIAINKPDYNYVTAHWAEPHIRSTSCPQPLAEATWVGLSDNVSNGTYPLAQAGTAYGEGYAGVGPHQAFWEFATRTSGGPTPFNWSASPGDDVNSTVQRTTRNGHAGYSILVTAPTWARPSSGPRNSPAMPPRSSPSAQAATRRARISAS